MDVTSAGGQIAARRLGDPEQAVALVHELAAEGELAVDATVDALVVTGLPALNEARTTAATYPRLEGASVRGLAKRYGEPRPGAAQTRAQSASSASKHGSGSRQLLRSR
ncbi:hypothetical protein [Streptomyces sp. D54]|uniref:hypothetical protein n=1 Tax=Streptomyces sp. D54 TaxID=1290289 RepID=UPI003CE9284E